MGTLTRVEISTRSIEAYHLKTENKEKGAEEKFKKKKISEAEVSRV